MTPDRLYTATPTKRFINKCIKKGVIWAIFSDQYGILFSNSTNQWYEKSPNNVSDLEFLHLVDDFDTKLKQFDEIWFYYNPGRFHPLYKKIIDNSKLKDKIKLFSHIGDIDEQ